LAAIRKKTPERVIIVNKFRIASSGGLQETVSEEAQEVLESIKLVAHGDYVVKVLDPKVKEEVAKHCDVFPADFSLCTKELEELAEPDYKYEFLCWCGPGTKISSMCSILTGIYSQEGWMTTLTSSRELKNRMESESNYNLAPQKKSIISHFSF
jgi:hypothetical protein